MPIQVRTELKVQDLLKGLEQLEVSELEEFIQKALVLKSKKTKPNKKEKELLLLIQQNFTEEEQVLFNELAEKRELGNLTTEEYAILMEMTIYSEQIAVERARALYELSQLRGKPVKELMQSLNVRPINYE
jgi:hypothetical protein